MKENLIYLKNYICENWCLLGMLILSFFSFLKSGDIKKLLGGTEKMQYKTLHSVEKTIGQNFESSRFVPVYRLNKSNNELVKTDELIDIDELVNSCKDTCLESVLSKFSELQGVPAVNDVAVQESLNNDLDDLTDIINCANDYREKYNLPDTYSVNEIFNFVNDEAARVKARINAAKEVKKDESSKNE